ncbi:sensor histidine kinase [Pseudofulvimonas gallinarii]|uniref:histidine kinase n=1 Tax=Pseudofulvimonas gallinarii TaxID=634155 RepID=A0A4R3L1E1_9GAMM|nr:ATP-binding protein [Pseudofulvimonas gallinarii]TCS93189.1 HAMP domain-containing protein [Pseudofulvimonas gallinarii]THD14052.1 ATP-binding protein [Pseudofulvimonas gallinarii]
MLLLAMLAGVGLGRLLAGSTLAPGPMLAVAVAVSLLLCMPVAYVLTRPLARLLRALAGAVISFRDGDFSFSIASNRRDEFGDLVRAHNELGRVLRAERQSLFQRELLLHTVIQNAPTAVVLTNARGHVVHANLAARHLMNDGHRLEGQTLEALLQAMPETLQEAVRARREGLFALELQGQEEVFHLATRSFRLHGQRHQLYLIRHMTREISRQEVASWKKVIRVISHERNNSLAPISSLAHSGRMLAARGDVGRLDEVLATIGERAQHLGEFIRGYAAFAKLPLPRREAIPWQALAMRLSVQYAFRHGCELADDAVIQADPAQLEQALINLLKNAHESGSAAADVELAVGESARDWWIEVRDRGPGMSSQVIASALVPFYSTKRSGTGLGLALAREIVEAHGGRLSLANRADGGLGVRLTLPKSPEGDAPPLAT